MKHTLLCNNIFVIIILYITLCHSVDILNDYYKWLKHVLNNDAMIQSNI
jgi:hypothetical protein